MKPNLTVLAVSVLLLVSQVESSAQMNGGAASGAMGQAAAALTGDQQSLAKRALCSALASHFANPADASPSALSSPAVLSSAAPVFAAKTSMPVPGATEMLKAYIAAHATDIIASCAVSNATEGLTSKLPGGMPSMPKIP